MTLEFRQFTSTLYNVIIVMLENVKRGVNVYLIIGHGILTISSITYDIQVMNYFNNLRGSQIYHV